MLSCISILTFTYSFLFRKVMSYIAYLQLPKLIFSFQTSLSDLSNANKVLNLKKLPKWIFRWVHSWASSSHVLHRSHSFVKLLPLFQSFSSFHYYQSLYIYTLSLLRIGSVFSISISYAIIKILHTCFCLRNVYWPESNKCF